MKIVVGMSGGVDSAVSAYLLKQMGYEVVGVHFKMENDTFFSKYDLKHKVCCSPDDTIDAMKSAKKIGIDLHIIDLKDRFRDEIIKKFIRDYNDGVTPNPCAWCNRKMKFYALEKIAKEIGANGWATGHYAIAKNGKLFMASDQKKDQSYFLALVKNILLKNLILPVGELLKPQVRSIAASNDLIVATKPDSQDVCFIPDGDLGAFFRSEGVDVKTGPVVTKDGEYIGDHSGYQLYAIGQRKGVGIATGERMYVIKVEPENNTVIVGTKADLLKTKAVFKDLNLMDEFSNFFDCECKVRSTAPLVRCTVNLSQNTVEFSEPVIPVPGQIIAFYKNKQLIGGAVISKEGQV